MDGLPRGDELPRVGWLVPITGSLQGKTLRLGHGSTIISGASPADIVLSDAGLASPHARIVVSTHGFEMFDIDDAGTYVNGRRVSRCQLLDNDGIRFGRVWLKFKTIND